jgi:arylsulfatase A-like enzyme/Tfp pilus assembly protein PilF
MKFGAIPLLSALLVLSSSLIPDPSSLTGSAAERPNVLLVTLDTVRADRMGFLGSTRGLTPALDAFARGAIVFERAYAQAPTTTVSHATLLTGTYPPFHGVRDFGAALPATVPYLPDVLRQSGYHTAAFVASLILDPRNGTAPGFDRGFDAYDAGFRLRRPGEDRYRTIERRGDEVVSRALEWIAPGKAGGAGGETQAHLPAQPAPPPQRAQPAQPPQPAQPVQPPQQAQRAEPWFLWVHLFDAHDPYDPPTDLKTRYARAPYDGEIASLDRSVGRLLQSIPASTIVAIAGDHGEALGDHGEDTHGVFLYDATLRVPLVMRIPGAAPPARVTARVRLADVAPTIMEAAGVVVPKAVQGESLMPLARAGTGAARTDRQVFAETDYPRQAFGWSALLSWRADGLLFVRAPRRELYDERGDAAAASNLAASRRTEADRLERDLEAFIRRTAGAAAGASPSDPALARRLAALGYVGGAGGSGSSAVDPKDRIATANALRAAIADVEDGAFERAIPRLERVTVSEPTIQIAQLNLGIARSRQRQFAAALAPLRKAIELEPEAPLAHYELASALYETGDLKGAAEHFGVVAQRMPQWADARYSFASVLARIDRVADAMTELRAALALEARHFRANLLLGRLLTLQNQSATAVKFLETAADVQPANSEAHEFLADAYEKTGHAAAAAKERQRAQELRKR